MLESHSIVCSMSRRGNCRDSAAMKRCLPTRKTERLSKKQYRTRNVSGSAVFDHVERFYDPRRCHSTIGHISADCRFENLKYA